MYKVSYLHISICIYLYLSIYIYISRLAALLAAAAQPHEDSELRNLTKRTYKVSHLHISICIYLYLFIAISIYLSIYIYIYAELGHLSGQGGHGR